MAHFYARHICNSVEGAWLIATDADSQIADAQTGLLPTARRGSVCSLYRTGRKEQNDQSEEDVADSHMLGKAHGFSVRTHGCGRLMRSSSRLQAGQRSRAARSMIHEL